MVNHYRYYNCNIECPKLKARELQLGDDVLLPDDLTDVESRIEALETKTQNQEAESGVTTFSGDVEVEGKVTTTSIVFQSTSTPSLSTELGYTTIFIPYFGDDKIALSKGTHHTITSGITLYRGVWIIDVIATMCVYYSDSIDLFEVQLGITTSSSSFNSWENEVTSLKWTTHNYNGAYVTSQEYQNPTPKHSQIICITSSSLNFYAGLKAYYDGFDDALGLKRVGTFVQCTRIG